MQSDSHRPLYEVKANLFKGLAHPLRVRVLEVLSAAPEASVSELLDATGLEASHLSQHLAVLKRNLLVVGERRGNQVYYRLAYPQVADLLRVARTLLGEILETTERQLVERAGLPEIPPTASLTGTSATALTPGSPAVSGLPPPSSRAPPTTATCAARGAAISWRASRSGSSRCPLRSRSASHPARALSPGSSRPSSPVWSQRCSAGRTCRSRAPRVQWSSCSRRSSPRTARRCWHCCA